MKNVAEVDSGTCKTSAMDLFPQPLTILQKSLNSDVSQSSKYAPELP